MPAMSPASPPLTILYRPVGPTELNLIRLSGWTAFPPVNEMNRSIVGRIEVTSEFHPPGA